MWDFLIQLQPPKSSNSVGLNWPTCQGNQTSVYKETKPRRNFFLKRNGLTWWPRITILLLLCVTARTWHHVCLRTVAATLTEISSTLSILSDSPPCYTPLKCMPSHTAMVLTKQAEIANTVFSGTYERLYWKTISLYAVHLFFYW